ncbi:MAG: penicillin acylase family protein [Alphaproteobacteria bacterium]
MIHWRQSVLILILLMIALLAIAGWNWLRSGLPQIDGQIYLPNLKQPVQIQRDHYGIIFIKSKTQRDAYTALGYAHAQDRLWQMELMRRAGAGRLSEIFGTRTSQTDRFLRTLGLRKAAEKSILQLSIEVLDALSAYSDGVNAYIKAHKNDLPPEFTLFKIIPEPWKPLDSMIWQKLMAMSLSQNWRTEALRAQLATQLSSSDIQLFLPVKNQGAPLKSSITTIKARDWASLREIYPPSLMSYGASNAWVIAGNRSASGKPLLANDPHLSLELPILWYLARIDAPDYHIAGATVPGVPFHILGHNTNIAWGFTSSGTDVEDLIIEQTDPENPNNYLTENGSTPYLLHTEDLRIHNAPTEHLIIRETRHGPIISDVLPSLNFLDSSKTIALRSTTLSEKDLTAESLYRVNTARNVTDLKDALDLFMAPVQNVVFADTLGNIGIRLAGLVPIRSTSEQGPIPTDGSTADRRWKGFVPPKDLPQINNPSQGFLSNANESLSSELISEFEPP